MALLDDAAIAGFLASHPGWEMDGGELMKTFVSNDFGTAIAFVNQVAELSEGANHHPDIAISWNRVTLRLSTHSEGGLTGRDIALAGQIDELRAG
ncbi:MAG TPA: 4a-hydroxytetrahydrobiopterin dehydratase [Acidimicrobiia bacterium]|jgi:4a-hydroxytetrahydrobiopterin dehydratase